MRIINKSYGLAIAAVLLLAGSASSQPSTERIENLAWLAGCWEQARAGSELATEVWMRPAGKMMLGVARSVKGGNTTNYEFTRLEETEQGIFYVAKPSQNKDETSFKLVKLGKQEAVFENLQHDFPQRIIYRRAGDALFARAEGRSGGKTTGLDYNFRKARCD